MMLDGQPAYSRQFFDAQKHRYAYPSPLARANGRVIYGRQRITSGFDVGVWVKNRDDRHYISTPSRSGTPSGWLGFDHGLVVSSRDLWSGYPIQLLSWLETLPELSG